MKRRHALLGLAAIASGSVALPAFAQRRFWRIGYHSGGSAESNAGWLEAFRKGMAELGWTEASHYVVDARYADGDDGASLRIAKELVATQPDVILTTADASIVALSRLTRTIPIVFALGADPVGNGYAKSLQRPGGNATGLSSLTPELAAKRLQLLKEALPQTAHVVALFEPMDAAGVSQMKGYQSAAAQAKVRLSLVEVRQISDIEAAFQKDTAADAYVIVAGRLINIHRKAVAERITRARAPAISSNVIWAEAGLLMTYGVANAANFRRAAVYVDKILKGANPGDLAIEQPAKLDLVINARAARAIGIAIPQSLRLQAERVIE